MMKIVYKFFFVILLGLNISNAFAVTINAPIDQSVLTIQAVIDHEITAVDLTGMQVIVDGKSAAEWNGTSANGDGWGLNYFGADTSGGIWRFTNNGSSVINTVILDAFGGDAVFDNIFGLSPSTEGSFSGKFDYNGPAVVEFLGPVKLASSSAPIGDLFRGIEFDFSGTGGLLQDESFSFVIDSDQFAPVPVPPALMLFFSGLLGLLGLKRKLI